MKYLNHKSSLDHNEKNVPDTEKPPLIWTLTCFGESHCNHEAIVEDSEL